MFWAGPDSKTILDSVAGLGLYAGQLGVPPDLDCDHAREEWARGLEAIHLTATSAVCSYLGEDYADLATVHKTVGFTTQSLRADRIARTKTVSGFAHSLSIPAVSCHIGFIPTDPGETLYKDLCELTRSLCDYCGKNGQDFVLETGQESAEVLLAFIGNVQRTNLKVNFDPANMIMYGSGDPIEALQALSAHVVSVHCKDAHAPAPESGLLGSECVLGDGEVDFPAFLKQLKDGGYQGALTIEREEADPVKRMADIKAGILRLQQWKAAPGL